jgi:hypothetical protein
MYCGHFVATTRAAAGHVTHLHTAGTNHARVGYARQLARVLTLTSRTHRSAQGLKLHPTPATHFHLPAVPSTPSKTNWVATLDCQPIQSAQPPLPQFRFCTMAMQVGGCTAHWRFQCVSQPPASCCWAAGALLRANHPTAYRLCGGTCGARGRPRVDARSTQHTTPGRRHAPPRAPCVVLRPCAGAQLQCMRRAAARA